MVTALFNMMLWWQVSDGEVTDSDEEDVGTRNANVEAVAREEREKREKDKEESQRKKEKDKEDRYCTVHLHNCIDLSEVRGRYTDLYKIVLVIVIQ